MIVSIDTHNAEAIIMVIPNVHVAQTKQTSACTQLCV